MAPKMSYDNGSKPAGASCDLWESGFGNIFTTSQTGYLRTGSSSIRRPPWSKFQPDVKTYSARKALKAALNAVRWTWA